MKGESDLVFADLSLEVAKSNTVRKRRVAREENNFDLWLDWPDRRPLLIENKVFSLPNEQQLEEYTIKAMEKHGKLVSFCLLSLSDPHWPENRKIIAQNEWRWLGYDQLASLISSALPANDVSYPVETMRRYAIIAELLANLAERVTIRQPSEPVALPDEIKTALADNRLKSSMEKLRTESVARYVEAGLLRYEIVQTYVHTGFTNKKPIIEGFCEIESSEVGWQLQGNQFRRAIKVKPENIEAISSDDELLDALFDFSCLDDIIGTVGKKLMPKDKKFNKCDPAKNSMHPAAFLYRYKNVPSNFRVSQLEAAAVAVARDIARV